MELLHGGYVFTFLCEEQHRCPRTCYFNIHVDLKRANSLRPSQVDVFPKPRGEGLWLTMPYKKFKLLTAHGLPRATNLSTTRTHHRACLQNHDL